MSQIIDKVYRSVNLGLTVHRIIEMCSCSAYTDGRTDSVIIQTDDGAQFEVSGDEAKTWHIGDAVFEQWSKNRP